MENLEFNKYQSSLEELHIENYPAEVQEQFFDFINNVPFIKWLISPERTKAKDLPRDEEGRIKIDLTKPHVLEDMDYNSRDINKSLKVFTLEQIIGYIETSVNKGVFYIKPLLT